MTDYTSALFSSSIGLGGVLAFFKIRQVLPAYRPFLFLLWAGLLNEIVSFLLISKGYSNVINYNLYVLAECLFIARLLQRWQGLNDIPWMPVAGIVLLWAAEWVLRPSPGFCSFFIIASSLGIVLGSIYRMNQLLLTEGNQIGRHPQAIACIAFMLYFSLSALTESYWVFGLSQSQAFRVGILAVQNWINLVTNLLYAYCVLWMPLKPVFILHS